MKIGLISDIHSNIYALKKVLRSLGGTDLILCAGDITGYYPFVNEVFEELDRYSVIYIKGNHDAYLCGGEIRDLNLVEPTSFDYTRKHITNENLDRLDKAPIQLEMRTDGLKISMFHGSPWDKLEGYVYPDYPDFDKFRKVDADVIILGHTHYPLVKRIGGKLIINPGSCGQPRDYDPRASFAIFDTSTKNVAIKRLRYDVEKVCEEVRKLGLDRKLSAILTRSRL